MILYKYLPPQRVDVLENRMIRFTRPQDFNDPFEFRPSIGCIESDEVFQRYIDENFEGILESEVNKLGISVGQLAVGAWKGEHLAAIKAQAMETFRTVQPEVLPGIIKGFEDLFNTHVGVLCLSETSESILMWGHYTQSHRGFVVGFDKNSEFFKHQRTLQDEFGFLRKVEYSEDRPIVDLSNTTSKPWFQTKSQDWAYEKEWRMVRLLSGADHSIGDDGAALHLFAFPQSCVREIVIGMNASPELKMRLQSLISSFPNASLLQAQMSPDKYAIVTNRVAFSIGAGRR